MEVVVLKQEAHLKLMDTQMKAMTISPFRDYETQQSESLSSKTTTTTKTKKVVRFDTVLVHEHPIIVGCNPAVSSGVPITIAWNSISSRKISINKFEFDRCKERVSNPMFLKTTRSERWNVLQNLGFPSDEMRLAEQEAKEIRCLRDLTNISDHTDDATSLSRIQAILQESRSRREYILKQTPLRSMRLRRFLPRTK
jgi:hypothetical protein